MTALRGQSKIWDMVIGLQKRGNQNRFQEAQELWPTVYFFVPWLHCRLKHSSQQGKTFFSRLLTNIMNIFPFGGTRVFIAVPP